MPSEIIPSLDLAPSVPSRIVTITAADVTKGTPQAGKTVTFKLRGDLRVPADGAIISAGSVTLTLDDDGKGRVRLPCYTTDTRADSADGEWYIEVSKSWVGQTDLIRVPVGTTQIALAAIEPVREIPLHAAPAWLLTGAGVEVVEGSQWNATVTVTGGTARFRFTVPPGGTAWARGELTGSSDLDLLRASNDSGVYWVLTNADATTLGLPSGLAGYVTVSGLGGGPTGAATQVYTVRTTGETYHRSIAAGSGATWREWGQNDGRGALRHVGGTLGTTHLDTVLSPGIHSQSSTGSATADRNYPVQSRGFLVVLAFGVGPTLASQTYHATWLNEVWTREYYAGAWSPWVKVGPRSGGDVPDSIVTDVSTLGSRVDQHAARITTLEGLSGDNPITGVVDNGDGTIAFTLAGGQTTSSVAIPPAPAADQADYVHQAAALSPYKHVEVRKIQAGQYELSAVAPSGSRTTYLFRGNDDYLISSSITVSDTAGTATAVGPHSNRDYAIQVAPAGLGLAPAWVPHHGTASAFAVVPPRLYDGDTPIDVDAMTNGQTVTAEGTVHLVQHIIGRHPQQPDADLIEVWTTHSIQADGTMTITGRFRALADIELGSAYLMMVPVSGTFDRIVSSIGNAYPNTADLHGTSTPLVAEADMATSYLFLDSTRRGLAVAFRCLNPGETWRRGKPGKEPVSSRAFIEHRNADVTKIYQRPWTTGTVLPAGTVQRFSGEYLYLQAPGIYEAMAL